MVWIPCTEPDTGWTNRGLRALTLLGRYGLTWIPFIQAGWVLSRAPGADERAMLAFFIPPIFATVFVIADNGRFHRTAVRAAWVLLLVTAIASLVAELTFLRIKPQFPALPDKVDRVMVFYLIGWYSYVLVICPGWFVCWRTIGEGRYFGRLSRRFIVGSLFWLCMVVAFAFGAARKLI